MLISVATTAITKYIPYYRVTCIAFMPAGGDGTELFEEIGHTSAARALMVQFCIGVTSGWSS